MANIDPSSIKWDAAPAIDQAKIKWDAPQAPKEESSMLGDLAAGAASGFADLGDTLINAATYLPGKVVPAVKEWNDERNASLEDFNDAHKDSTAFSVGRVGGNIAATYPIGGVIGGGLKAVAPVLRRAAPVVSNLAEAVTSGGFKAGTAKNLPGVITRAVGGAINGGISTAAVHPEDAGKGALIGGILPPALQAGGWVGGKIGQVVRGPGVADGVADAARGAREAGYVIPPTQMNPSLVNRVTEGFAGKLSTGQSASVKNQAITNKLTARALGLPEDAPITLDAIKAVRQQAGTAYENIRQAGQITADPDYLQSLKGLTQKFDQAAQDFPELAGKARAEVDELVAAIGKPSFDANSGVDAIRLVRDKADEAYAKGNRDLGSAYKSAANAMEALIERNLAKAGEPAKDMLQAFRDARKLMAKTYTAEQALNQTTGAINAHKLAGQLKKGKPLSDELLQVAQAAQAFPTATREVTSSMPGLSPLDFAGAGSISAYAGNPYLMGLVAARPLVRGAILSEPAQKLMTPSATVSPAQLSLIRRWLEDAAPVAGRAAPVLTAPALSSSQ